MMIVTTTARRIARRLNRCPRGGFCVFHADGNGGAWYADGAYPDLAPSAISVRVPLVWITARDVQKILDEHAAAC